MHCNKVGENRLDIARGGENVGDVFVEENLGLPKSRVEVITSVQRRRRWPTAEKIRLVEETMQPGMSVSYVARRARRGTHLLRLPAGDSRNSVP
jgi:Transposase